MVNLMMGLALGLSVLSAAAVWVNAQWQIDRQTLLRSHTQQDVRALLDTLVHDIRRANFQGANLSALQSNSAVCGSPFCGLSEDFELSRRQILFSLDRNDNGIKDNNDCSGFRVT
jgi:type IV pilus assembly protein PilW